MSRESSEQLQVYNRYLRRKRAAFAIACAAAVLAALYAVGVGSIPISIPEIFRVLLGGGQEMNRTAVLNIRLPRVTAAILVGAALASAGAVMQCVLRNPLASASTLGVSQGAAFGAAVGIVAFGGGVVNSASATTAITISNPYIVTLCAFVSTIIGATDYLFFHGGTEDMSIGTSMLYLVPGVPLINGVMDIVDHHVLNGVTRLTNAMLLIICIAIGLSGTVILLGIDPTTFTAVHRPDIITATIADGLFAAVAAIGFAIISNPPRRALLICALLACVGHGVRYFLMHNSGIMLDQVTASAIAGFAIGLLAVPFAMRIHCPAECFAFPSLLPMVPGMFAYKAVRDLINIVRLPDDYTVEYVARFFHNGSLTLLVMFGMVVGCIIPIFIFHRQSFSVTRQGRD